MSEFLGDMNSSSNLLHVLCSEFECTAMQRHSISVVFVKLVPGVIAN